MGKVYSKYKILGGFGLLLILNLTVVFGSYQLLSLSKLRIDQVDFLNDGGTVFEYGFIIGINLLFLLLFSTQCRSVIVDSNGITFINPLVPFLRKSTGWSEFDYHITVEEISNHTTYEAVWLIKDGKIKGRFSSFYFSNYEEIKSRIQTKSLGEKHFNPFLQLLVVLGLKRIKTKLNAV